MFFVRSQRLKSSETLRLIGSDFQSDENRDPTELQPSGDLSAVAPPVPIPNTEVKRCSPDGSASIGCARVGRCQYYGPAFWKQKAGPVFLFPRASTIRRFDLYPQVDLVTPIH